MVCAVCIFCGLPGAGKSTVAENVRTMATPGVRYIHVCYDSIMPYVKPQPDHSNTVSAWKSARMNILQNLESLICSLLRKDVVFTPVYNSAIVKSELDSIISEATRFVQDHDVVFLIDDNMHYRGMRHEYYAMCSRIGIGFSTVYFDIPIELCHDRNGQRPSAVPRSVIDKMYTQLEPPKKSSCSGWEKHVLYVSPRTSLQQVTEEVLALVGCSICDPACPPPEKSKEVEEARTLTRQNFIHQADVCLRKSISQKVQELRTLRLSEKEMATKAATLTGAKKSLLQLLKHGYIDSEQFSLEGGGIDMPALRLHMSKLIDSEFM